MREFELDMLKIVEVIEKTLSNRSRESKEQSLAYSSPHFLTLIDVRLNHKEVAEKTGIKYETVFAWRKRNIPCAIYKKYFKVCKRWTDIEKMYVNNLDLTDKEVADKIGRTIKAVVQYRWENLTEQQLEILSTKKHRISLMDLSEITFENNNKSWTMADINLILSDELNLKELAIMLDRTPASISEAKKYYKKVLTNNAE